MLRHLSGQPPSAPPAVSCKCSLPTDCPYRLPSTYLCTCILQLRRPFIRTTQRNSITIPACSKAIPDFIHPTCNFPLSSHTSLCTRIRNLSPSAEGQQSPPPRLQHGRTRRWLRATEILPTRTTPHIRSREAPRGRVYDYHGRQGQPSLRAACTPRR